MFRETLDEIIKKVEGMKGITLMGVDGIGIETISSDESLNVEQIGVEMSGFIRKVTEFSSYINSGDIKEFHLFFSGYIILIKMVGTGYFLMAVLEPDGNFGKARYYLKRGASIVEKEL